ncbi:DUF1877 family protein [Kitasatospora sp. NPDC002040]|uniref:DUF1877 family protein n=1 Tax=Kitasatospora sp. NPDC002040 TaxID=3154661 RepID=UPI0033312D35
MSVDFFWRRVSGEVPAARSPRELAALVPYWSDPEFDPLRAAGLVLGVERNGYLMHCALTAFGSATGPAQLPVFGGEFLTEGEEHPEYGFVGTELWVLDPPGVREAARFLRDLDIETCVWTQDSALALEVNTPGFARRWDADRAESLVEDLAALRTFFLAAAEAGDAVVKFESA